MKNLITSLLVFLTLSSMAQEIPEKKINTKVNEVTVFLDGAQITRTKNLQIPKGTSLLKFTGLSPFINPKSIQLKADGNLMVLSVNHQQNYLEKTKKSDELQTLEKKYRDIQNRMEETNMRLGILDDEIDLLNRNKKIGGENNGLTVNNLRAVADYYARKMTLLKTEKLKLKKQIQQLKQQQDNLKKQIDKIAGIKKYPSGEIEVKVSAQQATGAKFTLIYNVKNAHWFPSYDIRAQDINTGLQLVYKANLTQNTQVDWEHVKLSFSSSNPEIPGELPVLTPYRLGYHIDIPSYNPQSKVVTGIVTEASSGNPLPGVNILLKGTSIGAATDFDGRYSIMVPDFEGTLVFSYIGYNTKEIPLHGNNVLNVRMEESGEELNEVVVNAMGISNNDEIGYPNKHLPKKRKKTEEKSKSIAIPMDRIEKQTSVNFSINKPYTIKSNNQINTVVLTQYDIPADYEYIAVPKVTQHAYLISYIKDWEKYNLLSGEANVFMGGTAIGKTLLDTGYANDTLQISLGVDKGIVVKRELGKEYTGKKLIGSKKTDTRQWKITVKNNKNKPVTIKLLDQVPISITSDIEVEIEELSKGKLNEETGEVEWKFRLAPGEKKEFILRYKVKYPRFRHLTIE